MRTAFLVLALAACGGPSQTATESTTAAASTAPPTATTLPVTGSLEAAIDGPHRTPEHRARDPHRHPRETLEFLGIRPGMTVVELSPGGGWYSEILAPYLASAGRLVVGLPSATGRGAQYRDRFLARLQNEPQLFANVTAGTLSPPDEIDLGVPGSADAVLTFRNTHNWVASGQQEAAVYRAAFEVLKPGGAFGVVQHRAREGADPVASAQTGYVPEAHVVATAEAAGFVLEERSEINANPRDTTEHPEGVWTLPPVLRLGEQDRERYVEIGESDRMTLRFRKPVSQETEATPTEP